MTDRPKKRPGETNRAYARRLDDYDRRQTEAQIRTRLKKRKRDRASFKAPAGVRYVAKLQHDGSFSIIDRHDYDRTVGINLTAMAAATRLKRLNKETT